MATARERGRCRERLERLSESGLDCDSLRREAVADLQRVIGFDRWCWPLADPETLLPASGIALHDYVAAVSRSLELEYSTDAFAAKHVLARRANAAASMSAETRGDLSRSSRWDEAMRPVGIGDVAAVACRDALGCWGWIEAYRDRSDRSFEDEDLELLASIAPSLGSALRRTMYDDGPSADGGAARAGRHRARSRPHAGQLDRRGPLLARLVPRRADARRVRHAAGRDLPGGGDGAHGDLRRRSARDRPSRRPALGDDRSGQARRPRRRADRGHAARGDSDRDVQAALPRLRALRARAPGRRRTRRGARHPRRSRNDSSSPATPSRTTSSPSSQRPESAAAASCSHDSAAQPRRHRQHEADAPPSRRPQHRLFRFAYRGCGN